MPAAGMIEEIAGVDRASLVPYWGAVTSRRSPSGASVGILSAIVLTLRPQRVSGHPECIRPPRLRVRLLHTPWQGTGGIHSLNVGKCETAHDGWIASTQI